MSEQNRFSLRTLLIAVIVSALLFGIVGVPETLYLGVWALATITYVRLAKRFGPGPAMFAFLGIAVLGVEMLRRLQQILDV
jgi:hypothetical protein